ncbi:MAG: hypothetical protein ACE5I1_10015 [bacterium]
MLEDLRKKSEELVIKVHKLAVASDSIEEVELAEVEPQLAEELDAIGTKLTEMTGDVELLDPVSVDAADKTEFVKKINQIINDTDILDSLILAMPRPKSRVGRPKYYERIRELIGTIAGIIDKINMLIVQYPEFSAPSPNGQPGTPDDGNTSDRVESIPSTNI